MALKKCLSLKQPFAELLVSGKKKIELRKWNTKFRGEFLVHASKKVDLEACKRNNIDPNKLVGGAIVGKSILYDVKTYHNKRSFKEDIKKHLSAAIYPDYKYGFLIKGARKFRTPLVTPGKLRFFTVDYRR